MTAEIGGCDEQVDRIAFGQQRLARWLSRHALERLAKHSGKARTGKRRFEPASPHQPRYFVADFGPGLRRNALAHRIAATAEKPFRDRLSPDLGVTPHGFSIGICELTDIRVLEPQVGQGLERLPRGDGLSQEDRVDTTSARTGEDVRHDPQAQVAPLLDPLEKGVIGCGRAIELFRFRAVESATGTGKLPDLLGDAVHVDCKADAAIAHKGKSQFLLAHVELMPWKAREGNCVPQMFCLFVPPWQRPNVDISARIAAPSARGGRANAAIAESGTR